MNEELDQLKREIREKKKELEALDEEILGLPKEDVAREELKDLEEKLNLKETFSERRRDHEMNIAGKRASAEKARMLWDRELADLQALCEKSKTAEARMRQSGCMDPDRAKIAPCEFLRDAAKEVGALEGREQRLKLKKEEESTVIVLEEVLEKALLEMKTFEKEEAAFVSQNPESRRDLKGPDREGPGGSATNRRNGEEARSCGSDAEGNPEQRRSPRETFGKNR